MSDYVKLAPGVYQRGTELHLDLPEFLRVHGFADTPANRERIVRAAADMLPGTPVVETWEPWP